MSPEQVQKATRIVEQAQNDLKTAFQTITDRDQLRKTVEEILKRADEQFRNILTPEQAAKYDQLKHMKPAQPQIPYPLFAPLDHLARALSLTPDQIEKAKAIVEQAQNDLKTAFQTITDRDQLRKTVEEILKRADEQFRNMLTPEQATKYDQLKHTKPSQPQIPYPLFAPLDHLVRALGLTPDQIEKAKAIVEQAQNDLKTAFQTITDKDQLRQAVEEILKKTDEQFRGILTPDQTAKYDQLKHTKPAQPQIPYPLFAPLDHLARALSLTPDQIERAKAIVEQAQNDLKTAFQTITDRDQLRQAVEKILKNADEQFRGILTSDQAAKYDQLKQPKPPQPQIPYPLFAPLDHLARALSLTPDQIERAKAIVEQAQNDLKTAFQTIADRDQLRKTVEEILKKTDEQFRGILTPDQTAKYDQLKHTKPAQPQIPYPLFAPLDHLARALSLTPEQIEKAKAIVEQAQKDLKTAFQTITDKDQLRKAVEEILKRTDQDFQGILTPEQAIVYDRLKQGRKGGG